MTNQLPASLASRQRRSVIDDATASLGASRGAHISIKGGRFRLVSATGVETPIDQHYLDVVVVDANKHPARVYFKGQYVPGTDDPPVCFSDNGTGPSNQAMEPQAATCVVCPNNIRGSDTTFSGKTTTACDNRKKLAVIIPDDPAVNVYEFQIPPGSLSNLKAYGSWIAQQSSGVQGRSMDIADFVTRVAFDPDRQFVMTFTPVAFADDERTLQLIEYIDANKLSDIAVGRNDVACDPEQVKQMLLGGGTRQALAAPSAAPAPPPVPQGQQFTMPQRAAPSQIEAPPPPKRGRKAAADTPPPSASPAAPFMAPAVSTPPAGQQNGAAGGDPGIPAFLRRNNDVPPAPSAPPRFGVGAAPPPPAEIQSALAQAMNLPTRSR